MVRHHETAREQADVQLPAPVLEGMWGAVNIAAVECIRDLCPSDTADWVGIYATTKYGWPGHLIGNAYTCVVCGAYWEDML